MEMRICFKWCYRAARGSFTGIICTAVTLVSAHQVVAFDWECAREEWFGPQPLGLDDKVKKLTKPLYQLTPNSTTQEMANALAKFKKDLDSLYNTNLTMDQVFDVGLETLRQKGITISRNKLQPFLEVVKASERRGLSPTDDTYSLKKPNPKDYGPDLSNEVILGCVLVFSGALLCILPFGFTQSLGTGMIGGGITYILSGSANDKKK